MHRLITVCSVALLLMLGAATYAPAQDTCYADMDANGDGLPLSVADYILAIRYLAGDTTIATPPFHLDLNADCMIDAADVELLSCYFINGLSCFENGFPVPTCCDPELVTGACCLPGDSCSIRTAANCAMLGGAFGGPGTTCAPEACDCCELRGDIDNSGAIDISDITYMVAYLFVGGPAPACPSQADANGDGNVDIGDLAGVLIPFLFDEGSLPPCGPVYPLDRTYAFEVYELSGAPAWTDTLQLTFLGPGSSSLVLGEFYSGVYVDSVMGHGDPFTSMDLTSVPVLLDAGFTANVVVQGDVATGPIDFNTITGVVNRLVILREM